MRLYGVKSVYYSDENGDILKERVSQIEVEHQSLATRRYIKYLGDRR